MTGASSTARNSARALSRASPRICWIVSGDAAERAGYAECLAGRTDRSLLAVVDDYMDRHPELGGYPPAAVTMLALGELCAANMPRQPQMP